MEKRFIDNIIKIQGHFLLSHKCKLDQQKQRYAVSKFATNVFPSSKYDFLTQCLLLTSNHGTVCSLDIVLLCQSLHFKHLHVCDLKN